MVDGPQEAHMTPTWVKALVIAGVVVVLAVVIILLTTSGHGPGRHTS